MALLAAAFAASLFVEAAPGATGAVAAVFPPWWSQARIAAAAGGAGRIVAGGGAPFVIALNSDQPGLAERARSQGALLVLARDLRGLCADPKGHNP